MKKHVLFIVENDSVPQDSRVWNEALSVKDFGYNVSVICPNKKGSSPKYENLEGIDIYRHYMPIGLGLSILVRVRTAVLRRQYPGTFKICWMP